MSLAIHFVADATRHHCAEAFKEALEADGIHEFRHDRFCAWTVVRVVLGSEADELLKALSIIRRELQ